MLLAPGFVGLSQELGGLCQTEVLGDTVPSLTVLGEHKNCARFDSGGLASTSMPESVGGTTGDICCSRSSRLLNQVEMLHPSSNLGLWLQL